MTLVDSVAYNIPVTMVEAYHGRNMIVRSHDPAQIVEALDRDGVAHVSYVQILSLHAEFQPLMLWGDSVPVDLVLQNPNADLPLLYKCSPLLAKHPVRVSIPVVPGFSKAVNLAVSLNFAVKLEMLQPGPDLIEEMSHVVNTYLHRATVSQPIEYFHSMFLAFYREEPLTIWTIQEEDPLYTRYITDQKEETISRRFVGTPMKSRLNSFITEFKGELAAERSECCGCKFLDNCSGYFKWPRQEYRCDGMRDILKTLKEAAEDLRKDVSSFTSSGGVKRS
jgi:hypothetical protein